MSGAKGFAVSGTRGPGTETRPGLETSSGIDSPEAEGETGNEAEDEAGPENVVRITAVGDGWAISCWIRRSKGKE